MARKKAVPAPESVSPEAPESSGSGAAAAVALPPEAPPPGRRLGLEEFWPACGLYGISPTTKFYLYRLEPKINRALTGNPSSIQIVEGIKGREFGPDEILKAHGSGKYQVRFNDSNHKPHNQIYDCVFELNDPTRPPVLDQRELDMDARCNQSYIQGLRAAGLLQTEGEAMDAKGGGVEAVAGVAQEALKMVREGQMKPAADGEGAAFDRALKLAQVMAPKSDPLELAVKIAAMSQGNASGELVKTLSDALARMIDKQNGAAVQNPMAGLDQTLGIMEKLGVRIGRQSSGGREWFEIIPDTINAATSFLGTLALMRSQDPAAAAALAKQPAPSLPAPPVEDNGVIRPQRVMQIAERALVRFQAGVSGSDFAHGLVTMEDDGEKVYGMLALVGADQIMGALRQHPSWPQLQPRESEVRAWVDDFLAYGTEDPEGVPQ